MFHRACMPLMRRTAVALAAAESIPNPVTYLTDDEKMLVDTVRAYSLKHVAPRSRAMDEAGKMDPVVIDEAFKAGLMGIETPAELEGGGMSFFSSILAIEELARHDPAMSVTVDVQNTLVNNIFFRYANEAQKKRYLTKLATNTVGCFCLTEAGSGSDAFALKTSAVKKGNKWVINGTKMFITNAGQAGIFLVMANVDPSKGYKGITCFVVDTSETSGVTVARTENKLGIRASSTCELHFNNVEVPEENVIGEVGKGYKIAINILNEGRIGIGAQMLGIAQGSLDIVMPYLFQRKQFGQVIGDFQGMQMQYAECATQLHAARLLVYNAARMKQNNENFIQDAAMAKYFASVVAEKTASRAVEWAGGIGFMKDFGLERFYRDAKIGAIYEGTSIIQLQTIAKGIKSEYTNFKDAAGKPYRLSAVCPPSTTTIGTITILRNRLCIPNIVGVDMHIQNGIPIRHVTAPLANLRKQRDGSTQTIKIHLWAFFNGPDSAIRQINFSKAEMERAEDAGQPDNDAMDGHMSDHAKGSRGNSLGATESQSLLTSTCPEAPSTSPRIVKSKQVVVTPPQSTTSAQPVTVVKRASCEREASQERRVTKKNPRREQVKSTPRLPTKVRAQRMKEEAAPQNSTSTTTTVKKPPSPPPPPAKRIEPYGEFSSIERVSIKSSGDHVRHATCVLKDTEFTQLILREYPKLVDIHQPGPLVSVIKNDEKICGRSYNTDFLENSPVDGTDDATYSRCLSLTRIYGVEVNADRAGTEGGHASEQSVALHSKVTGLRHSCRPNAMVHYDRYTAPYSATCRCAVVAGIKAKEEVTHLYRRVDTLDFLLLSRERRRRILRARYFFDCTCARCEETTSRAEDMEATLTGVFMTDSSVDKNIKRQAELSEELHRDFNELQLMEESGVEVTLTLTDSVPPADRAKRCNRLIEFIQKYSSSEALVRLHENHWRLNLARVAYIQETVRLCTVRGATPEARRRDPTSRTLFTPVRKVFHVAMKQMEVEARFIPAGHPHLLITFDCFRYLMNILPPDLRRSVSNSMPPSTDMRLKELYVIRESWDLFKRASMAPSQQKALMQLEERFKACDSRQLEEI